MREKSNGKGEYVSEYAEKFRKAYKRLDEMKSLPTDWSRTGLKAISPDLIKNCRYILNQLKYPPHIVAPSKDGFVQFEFARQDGNYLDVSIRLGSVEVFRIKNDGIADYTEKREMYAPVEKISAFVVFCVDEFRGEKNERS